MDKQNLINALADALEKTLATLVDSALQAKDDATNEESKPENKYDTRGLEASYLAGAQAKRADELKQIIQKLRLMKVRNFSKNVAPDIGAWVEVAVDGQEKKQFFVLPFAGGTKISFKTQDIHVITPESPVGRMLISTRVGESFSFGPKHSAKEYEVLDIK